MNEGNSKRLVDLLEEKKSFETTERQGVPIDQYGMQHGSDRIGHKMVVPSLGILHVSWPCREELRNTKHSEVNTGK